MYLYLDSYIFNVIKEVCIDISKTIISIDFEKIYFQCITYLKKTYIWSIVKIV